MMGGIGTSTSSPLAGEEGARRGAVGRRGGRNDLLSLAKINRKGMTDAERKLWAVLRARRLNGWKFNRQEQLGDYIADFVCFKARLIIEADGSQHADSPTDGARTAYLDQQGFRVIRFWNNEILINPEGVATAILAALETPLPTPSPARGEGLINGKSSSSSSPLAGEDSEARPHRGLAELGEGANGANNG